MSCLAISFCTRSDAESLTPSRCNTRSTPCRNAKEPFMNHERQSGTTQPLELRAASCKATACGSSETTYRNISACIARRRATGVTTSFEAPCACSLRSPPCAWLGSDGCPAARFASYQEVNPAARNSWYERASRTARASCGSRGSVSPWEARKLAAMSVTRPNWIDRPTLPIWSNRSTQKPSASRSQEWPVARASSHPEHWQLSQQLCSPRPPQGRSGQLVHGSPFSRA
mmetsp:Transcript_20271/g.57152  ORF Transcript_20271/g.57152 Transcript_20271/m.57152 type:complete len:229 (-) Transcript_20271:347-1033(-)